MIIFASALRWRIQADLLSLGSWFNRSHSAVTIPHSLTTKPEVITFIWRKNVVIIYKIYFIPWKTLFLRVFFLNKSDRFTKIYIGLTCTTLNRNKSKLVSVLEILSKNIPNRKSDKNFVQSNMIWIKDYNVFVFQIFFRF